MTPEQIARLQALVGSDALRSVMEIVGEAVQAERERCAEIAVQLQKDYAGYLDGDEQADACLHAQIDAIGDVIEAIKGIKDV